MWKSPVYRPHDEAPALARLHSLESVGAWKGARAESFEYVSRGDFVLGRIYRPELPERHPLPLVLLVHGTAESAESAAVEIGAEWLRQGFAVAIPDLPLHGRRASPKLSEKLFRGVRTLERGEALDPDTRALVEEFARQSTSDILRGLDALTALPDVDAARVALVGIGLGGVVSSYALAQDARPVACVLAGGTARFADAELDAANLLTSREARSKCPILIVTGARTSEIPASTTRDFYAAAREPKRLVEISTRAETGPGIAPEAAREISAFLAQHLGR